MNFLSFKSYKFCHLVETKVITEEYADRHNICFFFFFVLILSLVESSDSVKPK